MLHTVSYLCSNVKWMTGQFILVTVVTHEVGITDVH